MFRHVRRRWKNAFTDELTEKKEAGSSCAAGGCMLGAICLAPASTPALPFLALMGGAGMLGAVVGANGAGQHAATVARAAVLGLVEGSVVGGLAGAAAGGAGGIGANLAGGGIAAAAGGYLDKLRFLAKQLGLQPRGGWLDMSRQIVEALGGTALEGGGYLDWFRHIAVLAGGAPDPHWVWQEVLNYIMMLPRFQ